MLIYRISKHKVQPELPPLEARASKLKTELSKSHLKIGDKVRFKKPRRNPIRGTIDAIKSDLHSIKWAPNGCPLNVVVKVDKVDKNGIFYGTELITTNMKKLIASF